MVHVIVFCMSQPETLSIVTKIRLSKSLDKDIQRIVENERRLRRSKSKAFLETEVTPANMMRALIAKGIEAYDREHR